MDLHFDTMPWNHNFCDPETGVEFSAPCSDTDRLYAILKGTAQESDFSPRRPVSSLTPEQKERLKNALRVAPSPHLNPNRLAS